MGKENKLQYHLMKANLYGLLAKKYEYTDPMRHIHFYRKHFYHTQKVAEYYQRENPYHDENAYHMNYPHYTQNPYHYQMNSPYHYEENDENTQ